MMGRGVPSPGVRVRRFRPILTLWLALVSTGVTFAHSHAGGATPHGHGVGLTLSPAPRSSPDCLHSHFVLLGLELDAPPPADGQARSAHALIDPATADGSAPDFEAAAPVAIFTPVAPPAVIRRRRVRPLPIPASLSRLAVLRL